MIYAKYNSCPFAIVSIHCSYRHAIDNAAYEVFLRGLGNQLFLGRDFNAKHTNCSSRTITPKGTHFLDYTYLSNGEPTYLPADRNKIPHLLDFFILNNIANCLDLSSDHTQVIAILSTHPIRKSSMSRPPSHQ